MNSLAKFEEKVAELSGAYQKLSDVIRDIGVTIDNLVQLAAESGVTLVAADVAELVSKKIDQPELCLYWPDQTEPANDEWSLYDMNNKRHFIRPSDPTGLTPQEAINLADRLRWLDIPKFATLALTSED
jgi:hypothetical protein